MAKKGRGHAKGAAFERAVCKQLSAWVSNGQRSDVFWRTSMSGGRATIARKKGSTIRQSGDIAAVALEGHILTDQLYFELKFYKNLEIVNFFLKQKGILAKFWSKTVEEADSYRRYPVLIVKQDRVPALLITTVVALSPFCSEMPASRAIVKFEKGECCIYHLDDVLRTRYAPYESNRRIRANVHNLS